MKLEIKKPDWKGMASDEFHIWFASEVEPINKILSDGVEVKCGEWRDGQKSSKLGWVAEEKHIESNGRTHIGLLINRQPNKKETEKDVLRDLVKIYKSGQLGNKSKEIIERAKAILEKS